MAMTARRFDRALRDAAIIGEWLTGVLANQIAAHHGVAAETVRAIAARTPGVVEERQRRLAEAEEANRRAVVRWSQEHPGDPIDEGAATLGVTRDQMRRWLGNRLTLHVARPRRARSIPDEEIVRSVRLWLFGSGGDTREESYRRPAKQHAWPSAATAMDRYGTWKAVLLAAGFAPASRRGRGAKLDR